MRLFRVQGFTRVLLLAGLTSACTLDHRTLQLARGGNDGAATAGSPSSGGGQAPVSPQGGDVADGGSDTTNVPFPVCDYSRRVSKECLTLVKNAGFATDTADWDTDGGVYGNWQPEDANKAVNSGSIAVVNTLSGMDEGTAPGAARQCLAAHPGNNYDLASDILVAPDQGAGEAPGAPYEGAAVLGAFFFDAEDCQGTSVGYMSAEQVTKAGEWVHVTTTGTAPELTRAISVRLGTLKPIREYLFQATFDNVFVREREP